LPKASFSCLIAGEPYRAPLHPPFGRLLRDASPDMGAEQFGRLDGGSRIPSHGRASAAHNCTDSSLGCSEECEGQGDKAAGAEGFGSLRDEGFARLRLVGAGHSGPVLRTRADTMLQHQGFVWALTTRRTSKASSLRMPQGSSMGWLDAHNRRAFLCAPLRRGYVAHRTIGSQMTHW
jgi:hypothetical protein